jgi:hypothetical protein
MFLEKINIEEKLLINQQKATPQNTILLQIKALLENDEIIRNEIKSKISKVTKTTTNVFNLDLLESHKIFHLSTIKSICVDYRLRFLDSHLFKNTIPDTAITKIKYLEKLHQTTLDGFKIMAPSKLFKLENADDPLLFAPIGNDYYYLIDKWGNDLSPYRKTIMTPFKNMGNLIMTILIISILTTFLLPISKFDTTSSNTIKFISFLFVFKSYCAIVLYYSFWKGKNFNTAIWDSKYYN